MGNDWTDGEVVYENSWLKVFLNSYVHKNIKKAIYTTDFGRRSAITLYKNKKILFVKQNRMLIDGFSFELPGGKIEDEESYENGALRECLEETGYKCNSISELAFFYPGLETLHNPTKVFFCDDFVKRGNKVDSEIDEVVWINEEKVFEMLQKGQFMDSLTQIGLLNFFRKIVKR